MGVQVVGRHLHAHAFAQQFVRVCQFSEGGDGIFIFAAAKGVHLIDQSVQLVLVAFSLSRENDPRTRLG